VVSFLVHDMYPPRRSKRKSPTTTKTLSETRFFNRHTGHHQYDASRRDSEAVGNPSIGERNISEFGETSHLSTTHPIGSPGKKGDEKSSSPLEDLSSDIFDLRTRSSLGASASLAASSLQQKRLFSTPGKRVINETSIIGNERRGDNYGNDHSSSRMPTTANSFQSRFTRRSQGPRNSLMAKASITHIVASVSENLARETCVVSLDTGVPTAVCISKQGNGQTYAETISYLEILQPHEIVLHEGRQNSYLARKILELFSAPFRAMDFPRDDSERYSSRRNGINADERLGESNDMGRYSKDVLRENRSHSVVKFISRVFFDQTRGAELLRRIARPETFNESLIDDEYILLSASYAVLQYTQKCLGATFAIHSVSLFFNDPGMPGSNNRLVIDRSAVKQLELLLCNKTGKTPQSLVGTIDRTKTRMGGRLLRTNLMAPPSRLDTINTRLELVDAFLQSEEFFFRVMELLFELPDVDKMITNIALVPCSIPPACKASLGSTSGDSELRRIREQHVRLASKGIAALVCIKTVLCSLPSLSTVLQNQLRLLENLGANVPVSQACESQDRAEEGVFGSSPGTSRTDRTSLWVGLGGGEQSSVPLSRHHLLHAIIVTLQHPDLLIVLDAVTNAFVDSAKFTRNAYAMRHQECFALRCADDSLMAVIRKAFRGNVDDIYRKADEYAEAHQIRVNVKYTLSRGYFLSLSSSERDRLPAVFILPAINGRVITCTTEEILSLNARARDNMNDLLVMTHDLVQGVMDVARKHYDAIAAVCDAIALLDLCHSFADSVTLSPLPWCRPILSERRTSGRKLTSVGSVDPLESGGALIIRNGRYCMDFSSTGLGGGSAANKYIPNDTYASEGIEFTLITGINGSGKSTYLKQIAIIFILAHCGSYVPAEHAAIPLIDHLCTRIGNEDDQVHNMSTFMLEMKETALLCNNATRNSLVLLDELGRATSNEDGVAIAWAVAEYLIKMSAITFFVTHYPQMTNLASIYPSAQNIHLESSVRHSDQGVGDILYTHRVKQGKCAVSSYGVELASACGWPTDVVFLAKKYETQVEPLLSRQSMCDPELGTRMHSFAALNNLLLSLRHLGSSVFDDHKQFQNALSSLKEQFLSQLDDNKLASINGLLLPCVDELQASNVGTASQSVEVDGGLREHSGDQVRLFNKSEQGSSGQGDEQTSGSSTLSSSSDDDTLSTTADSTMSGKSDIDD
jgi:DNA mismatch repair protein MSH4